MPSKSKKSTVKDEPKEALKDSKSVVNVSGTTETTTESNAGKAVPKTPPVAPNAKEEKKPVVVLEQSHFKALAAAPI